MVAHEFRLHAATRATSSELLRERPHRPIRDVHDRAVPRPLRDRAAARVDVAGHEVRGRRLAGRARFALHRRSSRLVRRSCVGALPVDDVAAGRARRRDGQGRAGESDDTFSFTLNFVDGGMATMIASFAATPTRGTRIAVMGDDGTLMAEQAGPNPTDDGVVIASRKMLYIAKSNEGIFPLFELKGRNKGVFAE